MCEQTGKYQLSLFSSCIRSRSEKVPSHQCLEVTAKLIRIPSCWNRSVPKIFITIVLPGNFWIVKEGHIPYSVTGSSAQQEADRFTDRQEDSELTAGFMWQTFKRTSRELGLISTVTSFIPKSDNVEIMYVTVENQTDTVQKFTAYGAIPVYGRSADNIRDHRNVTSMLHRIETTEHGINVCPTMSFDERGHQPNHKIYYVNGCSGKGRKSDFLLSDCRRFYRRRWYLYTSTHSI